MTSIPQVCTKEVGLKKSVGMPEKYQTNEKWRVQLSFCVVVVKGVVSTWGLVTKIKKKHLRKRSFIDVSLSCYFEMFTSMEYSTIFRLDAFDLLDGLSSRTNRSNLCPKLGAILILVYKTSLMSLILVSDSYVFVNELLLLNRQTLYHFYSHT